MGLNREVDTPVQHAHNGIKTAKYNVVTFLPIFLFEMFSRAAYLYFLLQVAPPSFFIMLSKPPFLGCSGRSHSALPWKVSVYLLQACLAWWSTVSPFGGTGSTAALAFVLVVAGIKAVWEDVKRHQEDLKTNKSTAHLVNSDGKGLFLFPPA